LIAATDRDLQPASIGARIDAGREPLDVPRVVSTDEPVLEDLVKVQKFAFADAKLEVSPGQEGEVFAGNLVDERNGGPITIGYGRYGPNQTLDETMAVDDVMIILEGRMSVTSSDGTVDAGPGEIVYMPKGEQVTIRSLAEGAVTAYVTFPHWREAAAADS
jgi:ethanolamine utilization protein EutQ (cupin superfamily)